MTLIQDQADIVAAPAVEQDPGSAVAPKKKRLRVSVILARVAVLVVLLLLWNYLPKIDALSSRVRFFDPFFISSPQDAFSAVWNYMLGHDNRPLVWPYLWETVRSALIGLVIGSAIGFGLGLLLSSVPWLHAVLGMYINAVNSIPRIALVPLIIAVAGVGHGAEILAVVINVFFVMFFNCLEGGRRVPPAVLDNAKVMAASPLRTMIRIRVRYVSLWAFAAIPNATAFSLLGVIFVQMLAGSGGIGQLLLIATANLDTTSNIGLIVFLSLTGVTLIRLSEFVKSRLLHWAETQ